MRARTAASKPRQTWRASVWASPAGRSTRAGWCSRPGPGTGWGVGLKEEVEAVFAAPPLLSEQLRQGKLDALLTFWPYAARLEGAGYRRVAGVSDLLEALGMESSPLLVGYVFDAGLARERPAVVEGFFRAIGKTNGLLAASEAEWDRLRPLMKAATAQEFEALKQGFRSGIPAAAAVPADAARFFDLMAAAGGEELLGNAKSFDAGLFWRAAEP